MEYPIIGLKELPGESTARLRIIATARRHFLAHGFRSVTMDNLAEELGMSKKTLYAHFPSKTALLEAMLLTKFHELETEIARITTECAADFLTGLHRLLACVQRHTEEIRPPFLRDMEREAPEIFEVVKSRRQEVIQRYFGQLLEEGRREGLIRKDVPVHVIIEILLGAVQAIMNPPRLAELGLTVQAGFSAIITVILEGVLSPKGRSPQ
jgi:AcrR family transcriptional regulator